MSVSTGVEENASSRFIDYTFATPWETLCSEIEQNLKIWVSKRDGSMDLITIRYGDSEYFFSYHESDSKVNESLSDYQTSILCIFKRLFAVSKFALLTPNNRWTDVTTSERQTIFSALCCGLQSAGIYDVPVFLASVCKEKFSSDTRDILGYQLKSAENFRNLIVVGSYESHICAIAAKHDLSYLDGLLRWFEDKISSMSRGAVAIANGSIICDVNEEFRYFHDGSILSKRPQPPHESETGQTPSNASILGNDQRSMLKSLWKAFPDYILNTALISELRICLQYFGVKQGSFVDNARLTTFQPSRQQPEAWRTLTLFKPLDEVAKKQVTLGGREVYLYSFTLSGSLRKLLAFFIYGHSCCTADSTMMQLGKGVGLSAAACSDIAERTAAIGSDLSPQVSLPFSNQK